MKASRLSIIGVCAAAAAVGCLTSVDALNDGSLVVDLRTNKNAPNVVIALDESGSMEEPASLDAVTTPCDANVNPVCCTATGGYGAWCAPGGASPTCNNSCKWDDVLTALTDATNGFIPALGGEAHLGFVGYPVDGLCGAPATLDIPIGSNNAAAIVSRIQASRPGGGTPTAATLDMIAALPGLVAADRDSFVVLVTDGLPNCNSANWGSCQSCNSDPSTCACPVNADGSSACCNPTTSGFCGNAPNGNQCLDGSNAVAAVAGLLDQGVKTIVVGFGAEARLGLAGPVLGATANAGGAAGICGGATRYCQVDDASSLRAALGSIHALLANACVFSLSYAPEAGSLVVQLVEAGNSSPVATLVNGTDYTVSGFTVTILGTTCALLSSSSPGQWTLKFSYPRAP